MLTTESLPDGNLNLRIPIPAGLPYRLETSTDLNDWESVISDIASSDSGDVVDDEGASYVRRFFRMVQEFGDVESDD